VTPHVTYPEFCPRRGCQFYDRQRAACCDWYYKFGSYDTQARGRIQRFRCISCGKTCSTQTFSIHYWTHSTEDYQQLLQGLYSGSGLRQYGRFTGRSSRVVQNRIRHLARNCLSVLDSSAEAFRLAENLTMDGFESFTRSQYFPNNITMVVGGTSQYIYGAIHTLMRRKGRMSEMQQKNRAQIDRHWRPRRGALRSDCATLLADCAGMIDSSSRTHPLTLWSDEHPEYPRALQRIPALCAAIREGRLAHRTVSSRRARTRSNPLFAVNYVDRQIRKNMGEHVRETVKQGREVNCQMERMVIFMVAHNFLTPHRIEDRLALCRFPTHADVAGVDDARQRLCLKRLFTHRHIWGHAKTADQWRKRVWLHEYENPPAVDFTTGKVSAARVALPPRGLYRHFLA
jgi:transposase-like protein